MFVLVAKVNTGLRNGKKTKTEEKAEDQVEEQSEEVSHLIKAFYFPMRVLLLANRVHSYLSSKSIHNCTLSTVTVSSRKLCFPTPFYQMTSYISMMIIANIYYKVRSRTKYVCVRTIRSKLGLFIQSYCLMFCYSLANITCTDQAAMMSRSI